MVYGATNRAELQVRLDQLCNQYLEQGPILRQCQRVSACFLLFAVTVTLTCLAMNGTGRQLTAACFLTVATGYIHSSIQLRKSHIETCAAVIAFWSVIEKDRNDA